MPRQRQAALQCWDEATAVRGRTLVAAIIRLVTTGVSRAGTGAARGSQSHQCCILLHRWMRSRGSDGAHNWTE